MFPEICYLVLFALYSTLFNDYLAFNIAQVTMVSYNRFLELLSHGIEVTEGPFCEQVWAVGSVSNMFWEELLSKCVEATDMGNGTHRKPQGVLIIVWETTGVTKIPRLPLLFSSCWHWLQNSYGTGLECNWWEFIIKRSEDGFTDVHCWRSNSLLWHDSLFFSRLCVSTPCPLYLSATLSSPLCRSLSFCSTKVGLPHQFWSCVISWWYGIS